jgi:BMFP domain-containing protein YqiC
MMNIEQLVNRVTEQLAQALPPGMKQLRGDLESNFKVIIQEALARMQLVTREEFDVQTALLARTRQRLEALEAQLRELEHQIDQPK